MKDTFFDAWILATGKDDAAKLKVWSEDKEGVKCCWGSDLEIQKYLNGFARVIEYTL